MNGVLQSKRMTPLLSNLVITPTEHLERHQERSKVQLMYNSVCLEAQSKIQNIARQFF